MTFSKYGRNLILRQKMLSLSRGLQQGSVCPAFEYENTFALHCDKKVWELIVQLVFETGGESESSATG